MFWKKKENIQFEPKQPDLTTIFSEGQRIWYAGRKIMVASFSRSTPSPAGAWVVRMQCVYEDNNGVLQMIEFGPDDMACLMKEQMPPPVTVPQTTAERPEVDFGPVPGVDDLDLAGDDLPNEEYDEVPDWVARDDFLEVPQAIRMNGRRLFKCRACGYQYETHPTDGVLTVASLQQHQCLQATQPMDTPQRHGWPPHRPEATPAPDVVPNQRKPDPTKPGFSE